MRYYASEEEMETDDILSPLPVDTAQYFTTARSTGTKISPKFKFPQSAPAMEQSRLNKLRFNFDFDCSHTIADKDVKNDTEEVSIALKATVGKDFFVKLINKKYSY